MPDSKYEILGYWEVQWGDVREVHLARNCPGDCPLHKKLIVGDRPKPVEGNVCPIWPDAAQ